MAVKFANINRFRRRRAIDHPKFLGEKASPLTHKTTSVAGLISTTC